MVATRGAMPQAIATAKKPAEALGVTLVSQQEQSALIQNTSMIGSMRAICELLPNERDKLLYAVDGLLRDARARRADATA